VPTSKGRGTGEVGMGRKGWRRGREGKEGVGEERKKWKGRRGEGRGNMHHWL